MAADEVEVEVGGRLVRISNPGRVHFPRYGRHADELCVTELAHVVWAVQMSTVEFHPWNSRRADTERPDEWRIDLDPGPRCPFATVPARFARLGDLHQGIDDSAYQLDTLLEWADRDGLD